MGEWSISIAALNKVHVAVFVRSSPQKARPLRRTAASESEPLHKKAYTTSPRSLLAGTAYETPEITTSLCDAISPGTS